MPSDEENQLLNLSSLFPKNQSQDGSGAFFDESLICPPAGVGLRLDCGSLDQVNGELQRLFQFQNKLYSEFSNFRGYTEKMLATLSDSMNFVVSTLRKSNAVHFRGDDEGNSYSKDDADDKENSGSSRDSHDKGDDDNYGGGSGEAGGNDKSVGSGQAGGNVKSGGKPVAEGDDDNKPVAEGGNEDVPIKEFDSKVLSLTFKFP